MRIAVVISTILLLGACGRSEPPARPAEPAVANPAAAPAIVGAAVPAGSHSLAGRTVTVTLPFRASDNLAWVQATPGAEARPFVFKGLEVKPGAGPNGSDLAVFTYEAEGPGHAVLAFGLIPAGRTLVGAPDEVFTGEVIKGYEADVTAE
jgi:hypothetical protein